MLSRHVITRAAIAVALAAGIVVSLNSQAMAGGGANCPPEIPWCTVDGTGGGGGGTGGGGGGGGGGSTGCSYEGVDVACYEPGLGYYNSDDQCYYDRLDPQPPANDPLWGTNDPATGAIYRVSCFTGPPPWGGSGSADAFDEFIKRPDAGPTPEQLAEQALASIRLDGADIQMAPKPGGVGGLVGLPVWMWTTVNAHTWGPIHASASAGALTVNITAKASKIVWTMGDGGSAVTCTSPGEAYTSADGGNASSDCGYQYTKPSYRRSGGKYKVTAVTTWLVDWFGGGDGGTITTTRTSTTTVTIKEQQVVVK